MCTPFRQAARLDVTTYDGRILHHERLARSGSPEDAVGVAEIERKFFNNVSRVSTLANAWRLRDIVMRLDALDTTAELTVLLLSVCN